MQPPNCSDLYGRDSGSPPVDQAAEQQVEVGAVILDVGFQTREHPLIVIIRRIVDVLHVGIVQLEDAETDVEVLRVMGLSDLILSPARRMRSLPISQMFL